MDVLTFETCWAVNSEIIKQVTSSRSIFFQLNFKFSWPCISVYLCKGKPTSCTIHCEYISSNASTCFGHIHRPSSGGLQQLVNTVLIRRLSVVLTGFRRYTVCLQQLVLIVVNIRCTSRWWAVDMPETCRGVWWNILMINQVGFHSHKYYNTVVIDFLFLHLLFYLVYQI